MDDEWFELSIGLLYDRITVEDYVFLLLNSFRTILTAEDLPITLFFIP